MTPNSDSRSYNVRGTGNVVGNTGPVNISNAYNGSPGLDAETQEALKALQLFIERSGKLAARELFDEFQNELAKPQPRRSLLSSIWEGIKRELPTVVSLVGVVAKVAALVA
jgi:hypothetical protein